jgi:phosphate starvation-inducible PhoH-like protein
MAGLMLLNKHSVSDILYVRSIAESASKSLGSLPGTQEEKIMPFLMPMIEKLDELLPKDEVTRLVKEERVAGTPINYLRGASFNARFILADESQNLTKKELTTLVTRLGQFSKMVVAGDKEQSDINGQSGFAHFFDLFNDEESRENGIHCFAFTKDDIVRSGILRYIIGRLESAAAAAVKNEPMFLPKL